MPCRVRRISSAGNFGAVHTGFTTAQPIGSATTHGPLFTAGVQGKVVGGAGIADAKGFRRKGDGFIEGSPHVSPAVHQRPVNLGATAPDSSQQQALAMKLFTEAWEMLMPYFALVKNSSDNAANKIPQILAEKWEDQKALVLDLRSFFYLYCNHITNNDDIPEDWHCFSRDILAISHASSGGHESTSDPHTAVREICIKFIIQHAEHHVLRKYPGFKIAYNKFVQSLPSGPNSKIVSGPNTNLVYAQTLALMLFPPFEHSPEQSLNYLKYVRGRIRNYCHFPIDAVLEILSKYFPFPITSHIHTQEPPLPPEFKHFSCWPRSCGVWSPSTSWVDDLRLSRKPQKYSVVI